MISRAVELAMQLNSLERNSLYSLRDDTLLYVLFQIGKVKRHSLLEVVNDLRHRSLFRRIYTTALAGFGHPGVTPAERDSLASDYHYQPEMRRAAERKIAERLGVSEVHVNIYCPSPSMALKEADVPVEIAPGVVRSLADLGHPDVEGLKQKHAGIWRFYVFLKREAAVDRLQAGRICEEIIGHPNLLGA
jgi:hypothetical protein